jgi:hypothetical protein
MSSVVISGDTSGAITLAAPAVAGTYTNTLPTITATLLADAGLSNASNGYQKFSNGLIVQWGLTTTTTSPQTVTFPIAFPTACLNVQATATGTSTNTANTIVYTITTTNFIGATANVLCNFYWVAIGY